MQLLLCSAFLVRISEGCLSFFSKVAKLEKISFVSESRLFFLKVPHERAALRVVCRIPRGRIFRPERSSGAQFGASMLSTGAVTMKTEVIHGRHVPVVVHGEIARVFVTQLQHKRPCISFSVDKVRQQGAKKDSCSHLELAKRPARHSMGRGQKPLLMEMDQAWKVVVDSAECLVRVHRPRRTLALVDGDGADKRPVVQCNGTVVIEAKGTNARLRYAGQRQQDL